ncbi:MAG: SDR family oxidoreductase [Pseudomonadaceae bacterium]|nr:SDR family oxidoreductase [Pseudomonadaceae bacterium]
MSRQTVLITGVSRGLGTALVHQFIKEGFAVCGLARNAGDHLQFQELYNSEQYLGVTADVCNYAEVELATASLFERYKRIDIVFNNAAVYPKINFLEESAEDFLSGLLANIGGVANVCKAVLPYMVSHKQGKIYNLGSWADVNPVADSALYSASKGGIHALTKAIARDIAPLGLDIEIHEWIPGHLNTRMSDFTGIDPNLASQWAVQMVAKQASSNNSIFENDREWHPPEGIKKKLRKLLPF